MKGLLLLLGASVSPLSMSAEVPTAFAVTADKLSFHPTQPFRNGDRLYVTSPFISGDDILALGRCLDPQCGKLDIVRAWTGHRRHRLSDYVNIQQDGDYIFFAGEVPRNIPDIERRGCFRAAPLQKVCSAAQPLKIAKTDASDVLFRARFSSDSWLWVRRVRAAN